MNLFISLKSSEHDFFFNPSGSKVCNLAPERLSTDNAQNSSENYFAFDLFSLGCLIFQLYSPKNKPLLVFKDLHDFKIERLDITNKIENKLPKYLHELAKCLLNKNRQKRLLYKEISANLFPPFFGLLHSSQLLKTMQNVNCTPTKIIAEILETKSEILQACNCEKSDQLILVVNVITSILSNFYDKSTEALSKMVELAEFLCQMCEFVSSESIFERILPTFVLILVFF